MRPAGWVGSCEVAPTLAWVEQGHAFRTTGSWVQVAVGTGTGICQCIPSHGLLACTVNNLYIYYLGRIIGSTHHTRMLIIRDALLNHSRNPS